MQKKIDQLVSEAGEFLQEKAYDIAHDLEHHESVWSNVQKIAQEIEKKIDLTSLQISAMWHDVVTGNKKIGKRRAKKETAQYVAKRMAELGFRQSVINRTKTAILEHSVMNKQSILESKILADADLLEWFNVERFLKTLSIYTSGKAARIKKYALRKFAQKWIHKLPSLIHFAITRKIYHQKLAEFKKDLRVKKAVLEKYGQKIEELL